MATQSQISMDFAKAIDVSKKFKESADNINTNIYNKLNDSNQALSKVWTGDNAKDFITKAELIKEELLDSINDLNLVSAAIAKMAQEIYNAEMAALNAVQTKSQS